MTLPTLTQDALTAAHRRVLDHCWTTHPKEAVGLIWDDGKVAVLEGGAGAQSFYVSPRSLQTTLATRPKRNAIAIYHSHPSGNANPSATDLDCMREWAKVGIEVLWTIVVLGTMNTYPAASTAITYTYHPSTHTVTPYHRLSS